MSTTNIPKGEQRLFTVQLLNWIEEELDKEAEDFNLIALDNQYHRVPNLCFGEHKYVNLSADTRIERHNTVRFGDERELERATQEGRRDLFFVLRPEPFTKMPAQCSISQAAEEMQATIVAWEASEKCRNLITAIESVAMPPIDNIIAFGLGSISARSSRRSHQREHALAMTIARTLEKKNPSSKIPIYLQDPDYSFVCKLLLLEMGFQVIDGHGARGFTMINERTLVMSHNASIPIREVIADTSRPAVLYCKPEIPQEEHNKDEHNAHLANSMKDMDSVRTKRMMTEYDFVPIPGASLSHYAYYDYNNRVRGQGKDGEPFGNSVLYVRKHAYASQPFQP
ncbi:uncharacterized protein F4807DRAFT_429971 [Annulohypoxylon truncatum]|uniref:uncharacterized protein n=1 Tax=Annulohypoxylon truncatum TaxID=327061 RepID=UPI00200766A3|nr:uncharacterized protein F4807DRAFT_429971 [Annulohypoxylon truncatum]KAI1208530.1 hypothetical protein F4807DRAFT_429971 [Annulohypoxylon truncatum]